MPKKRKVLSKAAPLHKAASPRRHPKVKDVPVPDVVTSAERAPSSEPAVGEMAEPAKEPVKLRESTATGNDKIEILNHSFFDVHDDNRGVPMPAGVDLAIRNLAGSTIATAMMEVSFYDMEGNVVDTAKHTAIELRPDTSRGIRIESKVMEVEKVKSYDIRITTTRTAEQERVQLRCHDINRNAAGEEVVEGVVKNISKAMADAAVLITFYGANNVDIGSKAVVLRDIEPETIRQYTVRFKAPEGERMGTYRIDVGEIA